MAKGMGSIKSRQSQGPFKTSGAEMWPAKMCQWISTMLFSAWASSATTASKGVPDTQAKDDPETVADTFAICQPEGARVLGGFGPPRTCDLPEGPRDFHDGGGLCSPGRWPPDRRSLADGGWSWLRNKLLDSWIEAQDLAAGPDRHCRGPGFEAEADTGHPPSS